MTRRPTYYSVAMNNGKNVFCFGSILAGRHGKGAALIAKLCWGATNGVGCGRQGMAYAIPTKDGGLKRLSLQEIARHVDNFVAYAKSQPTLTFLVTPIGTGLAAYSHDEIKPMFSGAPANCVLPEEWK